MVSVHVLPIKSALLAIIICLMTSSFCVAHKTQLLEVDQDSNTDTSNSRPSLISRTSALGLEEIGGGDVKVPLRSLDTSGGTTLKQKSNLHVIAQQIKLARRKRFSNFVRVGRGGTFLRIGKNFADDEEEGENQDRAQYGNDNVDKRQMHRFIRIGKNVDFGSGDQLLNDNVNGDVNDDNSGIHNRDGRDASSFVRIGRAPSNFVRFGRAPSNFLRIGRAPSNFLRIGRAPSSFVRIGKSPSGFVRIGKSPSGFVRIGKSPSGFVRIGKSPSGFVRIGKSPNGFVRIGKSPSGFVRIGKSPSGFVHNGKANYDFDNSAPFSTAEPFDSNDRLDLGFANDNEQQQSGIWNHNERPSAFLSIGRSSPSNAEMRMKPKPKTEATIDKNRLSSLSETEQGQFLHDDNPDPYFNFGNDKNQLHKKAASSFVRIGKSKLQNDDVSFEGDFDNDDYKKASSFLGLSKSHLLDDINNIRDMSNLNTKRGFVRIGKSFDDNNENAKRGFIRIGRADPDIANLLLNKRQGNFLRIGRGRLNQDSPFTGDIPEKKGFVRIGKNSKSPADSQNFDLNSPSSTSGDDENTGGDEKLSDGNISEDKGPISLANRGSAFVRIGKIPSSAFVRIGKNTDILLEPEKGQPVHGYRKGQSSFVRIG